jgi:hypothetical protein
MSRTSVSLLVAFALTSFALPCLADDRGGPGESCRARSDCQEGLRCVRSTCVAPGAEPAVSPARSGEVDDTEGWSTFRLRGPHPFVGVTGMAGAAGFGLSNDTRYVWAESKPQAAGLFALRGGVFFGRNELALELSPMTYAWHTNTRGPAFQFNATYGHYLPMHEGRSVSVYWPLRIGVGMFAGNTEDQVFFQARTDLLGVALRVGHLMIDFTLSSFRYGLSPVSVSRSYGYNNGVFHHFAWLSGMSVSYVF